jgi:glycosyltransferase involved in cell wall biosynthesis
VDISVIVNVHAEGLLAVPTLRSVLTSMVVAESQGHSAELVVVLDRSPDDTVDVIKAATGSRARLVAADHGDLGLSRNTGVAAASGEWVSFIDGDDVWGAHWLAGAAKAAGADVRTVIWHSQYAVYFETGQHILEHVDMEDPDFDLRYFLTANYWTSADFVPRFLALEVPYQQASKADLIGYEDWNFHCRTLERGVLHKVVPNTVHFIRRRQQSMSRQMQAAGTMCIPHSLFKARTDIFKAPLTR